jgi:hypothetical protein
MVYDPANGPAPPALLVREAVVSWSAVIAGAIAAIAASVLLTVAATGIGYNFSTAGVPSRASLIAFTPLVGAGGIVIQVLAAALGGYLAGRLRHHWLSAHADEAHFRDTAHGLLAWAISTVVGAVLAIAVFIPYDDQIAAAALAALPPPDPIRAAHVASQAALFTAVGMLLSAFIAAVAARLGGLRTEEMHGKLP